MNAKDVLQKVMTLLNVEHRVSLAAQGSDTAFKFSDGAEGSGILEVGQPIFKGKVACSDGEYEAVVPTQNGPKNYKLVVANGVIAQFELLPNPGEQKMSEETKVEEVVETNLSTEATPATEAVETILAEDPMAALDARVKALEDAIAKLVGHEAQPEEAPAMAPGVEMSAEKSSKAKPFTGAPKEEAKIAALVNQSKGTNTIDRVFARMSN
jgi:hypothetical protein